ncbi:heparinase II/III family protein [Qipengyuania sp. 6B39]|uniref:heparinase II/III family protein n=1 Tax=Qipengyuania proteolytica TaxID=2867239 RepID=UPI001C89B687|nr:heparinase II/III family protein [Qipengyuania proteolytica]MBX7494719.1 heparinase II/III family protein [Qipengyuania proteolytica]
MSDGARTLLRGEDQALEAADAIALPLTDAGEALVVANDGGVAGDGTPLEPGRALVLADFKPPRAGPVDSVLRWAYRLGVPGSVLSAPLRKPSAPRLLGTVESPLKGERAAAMALRAGHLQVHGLKAPIDKVDFASCAPLTPPFLRTVHGFTWLRDLGACAPQAECAAVGEKLLARWLKLNPVPAKGAAWTVENAGLRLLAWFTHAPLILAGDAKLRTKALEAMETTARWLDRQVASADDRLGQVAGWCAVTAAGLLLPDGRPRCLYGEAGLLRALGELVSDDGGVLSRSPLAQMEAIALLVDLRACYAAVDRDPPSALDTMIALLVPPLLTLRMGDRGLGSWQGGAKVSAARLDVLIEASGVRARPGKDMRHWGYQRVDAGKSVLVMDAAPPPRARHARFGCASTLAFEFSAREQRIIVNCGGAELAGGQVPVRIEQGLRGTAAHSTLVLDDANSTAILIKGQIGKGVEEVDISRTTVKQRGRDATRLEAVHNGYAARHGLLHRRIVLLSADGEELRGEDVLEPSGRKGQRGKIGFALRFHLGYGIEAGLSEDRRGAGLALPDGSYWQFRLGGDSGEATIGLEDSLWVDGHGRPRATQQLVVEGLTARSGGRFPWLLKRMG